MAKRIILASASPRRMEILKQAGYDFEIIPANVDEDNVSGSRDNIVKELAKKKALACLANVKDDNALIIGSDTLVFYGDRRLGKPDSVSQWREYLELISGKEHSVITGVCICYNGIVHTFSCTTKVFVAELTSEDIDSYIKLGDDIDKAGGYAIQGAFAKYIPKIEGEYNNVVGFPIARFNEELKRLNII